MATTTTLGFSILSRYSGHGVTQARRDLAALRAQMATLNDDLQRHTNLLGGIPARWKAVGAAVALIAPAMVPIGAAALNAGAAFTTMAASVGAAMTIYGVALKGAIDRTNEMAEAGKKLSPVQKEYVSSVNAMSSAWKKFIADTSNQTLSSATNVVQGLTAGIKNLKPIIDAIHPSVLQVSKDFENWMKGDRAKQYAGIIADIARSSMPALVAAGKNVLNVLGDGFRAFAPMADNVAKALLRGSQALSSWSDSGGFQRFIQYVRDNNGPVSEFFKALGDALQNVGRILKEFSGGALSVLTDALKAIAALEPSSVLAFANALLLMRSPLAWLVLNCPPLRDAIIGLIGAMNPQTIYAVAAAFVALRIAFMFMNTALLTTPLGWLILGLTALAVAIVYIATQTTWFQTAWQYTWNAIKVAAEAVWTALTIAWQAVVTGFSTAWTAVSTALVTAWNAVWMGISTAVQAIWTGLQTAWNAVVMGFSTAWTTVSTALVTAWNAVWTGISTAVQAIWTGLQTAWNAVCTAFTTVWQTVSAALSTAWSAFWSGLQTAAQAIWTALQTAWNAVVTAFTTVWQTVSSALSAAWSAFWSALQTAAQAVWTALQTAWSAFTNAISTAWNTVSTALRTAWDAFWNALRTAAQAVWTALQTAWNAFLTAVRTTYETISSALRTAWQAFWTAIRTAAETVWTAIRTAWQAFLNAIRTAYDTVSNALRTAWSAFWNAIKTAAEGIWNAIRSAWDGFLKAVQEIWDRVSSALTSAWEKTWNTIKDVATRVWDGIKDAVEKGINGLLTPINMLIKGFNKITDAVGLDINIPEISVNFAAGGMVGDVPHFAAGGTVNFSHGGGVLNGYAPGRDTVPAMLSRGEGVLVPEAVRGLGGSKFVHWANSHYSNGRGGKRVNFPGYGRKKSEGMGFAKGGMLPSAGRNALGATQAFHRVGGDTGWSFQGGGILDPSGGGNQNPNALPGLGGNLQNAPNDSNILKEDDDDGGLFGFIKDAIGGVAGVLTGGLLGEGGGTANLVLGFIGREALEKGILPLIDKIVPNFGVVGEIMGGVAKKVARGLLDWLVKKDEEAKKEYEAKAVAGAQSVSAWAPLAAKALAMAGISPSQLPAFLALMAAESGGNPNAINGWDVNAKNGVPSQGLMQVIPPTFAAYHVAGTSNNILDPLANMAASANYIKHRYGGIVPGSPYANGTPGATRGMHLVGEEGPEMVNFAGGETVTPAKETNSILAGMAAPSVAPAVAAPAMPPMPDFSGMLQQVAAGGSSEDVIAQLQAIIAAAQEMHTEVQTAWTGITSAAQTGQSTLNPVLAALIAQYGTNIPAALMAMGTANTTQWTLMNATTQAQWLAMQAAVITPAKTEMTTNVPAAMLAMATANNTQWTAMNANTTTQWSAMRDGAFLEANTHMATNMPEWGNQMNEAVTAAWQNMGEATSTAWEGMKEGTRGPTNWIIENSYNNGLAKLWNEVAAVIFEDGAKTLPTVATLAKGGAVHGPGGERADRVPAMLSRGEHVWTAREVHRAGGHHAVQAMRSAVMGGRKVRGGVDGDGHAGCGHGFALGGWLGGVGNVGGSLSLPGLSDLKRGSLMEQAEPFLDALDSGVKGALGGSEYRKMGAISGALSPSDWMRQYIEKDDELNKIGSGGPPWVPGVSDARTSYDGHTVNQRTADMLNMAKSLGASFSVTQGSFSSGVAASAGTHDGGGVVDLVPAGDNNVGPLRAVGFAAWNRGAAYGSPSFSPHIHAVALGDPTVSGGAAAQVASYLAGGNGLADGGPDNYGGGVPSADGVTPAGGGGRNVDPADLEQRVASFDRGGYLQPGWTMAYNGTGVPEPVGHNLVPKGSEGISINMPITINGNADAQQVVDGINAQVLPKLRQALQKGTGSKG
jgi:SLT domain-containing protein/phage-related protein